MTVEDLPTLLATAANDGATAIHHDEGRFLFDFLVESKLTRTLEIGFAYGFSAAYIMTATGSPHVAIDPHPEAYGEMGLENLHKLGLAARCDLRRDMAHNVLPQLLAENRRFEFVFVDGDHKFDTTFVELYYLDLLVDIGGFIVFHDAWMPSIQHIAAWIRTNKLNYRFVSTPLANVIAVQKLGTDARHWTHFAPFTVRRSLWRRLLGR